MMQALPISDAHLMQLRRMVHARNSVPSSYVRRLLVRFDHHAAELCALRRTAGGPAASVSATTDAKGQP